MYQLGSACYVVNESKQILLGKRTNSPGKGQWAAPGGKLLHDAETFAQCAYRELLEETGIKAPNLIPIGHKQFLGVPPVESWLVFRFLIRVPDTTVASLTEADKCDVWEWFDLHNLPTDLLTYIPPIEELLQQPPKQYTCERCHETTPATSWGPGWITCPGCKFVARTVYEKLHAIREPGEHKTWE